MGIGSIRRMKFAVAAVLCVTMLAVGGCASNSGRSYSASEARQVQTVQFGTIKSIQEVTIEAGAEPGPLGTIGGGVVGGVLGSAIGSGRGRLLATVGGAVVGAVLGALGEKQLRTEDAYEFMIELDDGRIISVVQAADDMYSVGDSVRVLSGSGKTRVVR